MNDISFVRVRDQKLSLWQSVVDARLQKQTQEIANKRLNRIEVSSHPIMIAVNKMVVLHLDTAGRVDLVQTAETSDEVMLIHTAFQLATAKETDNQALIEYWSIEFRKYSNADWKEFLKQCIEDFIWYGREYKGIFKYNDWKVEGKGDINYGVINYKLPNNAKVVILGDWGTGMPDAISLLKEIMIKHTPAAIIHLGDIYYAGSPEECIHNFASVFDSVFREIGYRVPVFTIPGNHDYYSYGYAYYDMVTKLNQYLPAAIQPASYFCLQTQDMGWQFLAMDTGLYDSNPENQIDMSYAGPRLQSSEIAWHQDKLNKFKGGTILLSHHQVFTANSAINGVFSGYPQYVNSFLLDAFQNHLRTNVGLWLWGHEHNLVLYQNDLFGVAKGRLVGCSAFEEEVSADPYKVNYPQVPYLDSTKYRLDADNGYYNHGYAVIDFSTRKFPEDKASVSYYQYPSWGNTLPVNPAVRLVMTESFEKPLPVGAPIYYNQNIQVSSNGINSFISHFEQYASQYCATLGTNPVFWQIQKPEGSANKVYSGDEVMLVTVEPGVGDYNRLSVYTRQWLYYYKGNGNPQRWIIRKSNQNYGGEIRSGEYVWFESVNYKGQCLTPDGNHVTTKSLDAPIFWKISLPNSE
ncbi:metallophosphoesterase [Cytophagaceae bacterium YF14B1]|uniref:Metallophosphoesterase n=1 Tax=Xanthocytophaga flava TaxID=3048013 RepID=A0AAE3UA17_9BACT|nr:metallophosphoesterase [Xanthocytophaga flavus]MDJ1485699.1 metallophosphoesterase [Xanthocytophaga flavus]